MIDRAPAPRRRRRHPAARSRVAAGALSVAAFLGIGAGLAARSASGAVTVEPTQRAAVDGNARSSGVSWAANPGGTSLPPATTTHAS